MQEAEQSNSKNLVYAKVAKGQVFYDYKEGDVVQVTLIAGKRGVEKGRFEKEPPTEKEVKAYCEKQNATAPLETPASEPIKPLLPQTSTKF